LNKKQILHVKFSGTTWKQIEAIIVNGKKIGTLEVCYLEEKSHAYEGPFLKEERFLIHGIAERLGLLLNPGWRKILKKR
jgi:hypothetical protein